MEEAGGSSPFLFTHSCSPPRPSWIHWRTTGLFARALSQAVFTAVPHGRPVCGLKLSMEERDKCIPRNLFSPHLPELHRLPGISCHEPLRPGRGRITEDWLCRATGTPRRSHCIAHKLYPSGRTASQPLSSEAASSCGIWSCIKKISGRGEAVCVHELSVSVPGEVW